MGNGVAGRPVRRADRGSLPARYSGPGAAVLAPAAAASLGVGGVAAGAVGLGALIGQQLYDRAYWHTAHPVLALIGVLLIVLPPVVTAQRGSGALSAPGPLPTLLISMPGAALVEAVAIFWPSNSPPTAYTNFLYANLAVLACTVRRLLPDGWAALTTAPTRRMPAGRVSSSP